MTDGGNQANVSELSGVEALAAVTKRETATPSLEENRAEEMNNACEGRDGVGWKGLRGINRRPRKRA